MKIFGPKRARWELDSEELFDLLGSDDIVRVHVIKSMTVPLAVSQMGRQELYM